MPKGMMVVEAFPASPEDAEAFHKWYNEVHMQEIVAVDGFVAARRFQPVGHEGPYVTVYEIECEDDIETVRIRLTEVLRSGRNSAPVGVQLDPPPTVRYFQEMTAYDPRP